MSYICGMKGCRAKKGLCTHEWIVLSLFAFIVFERLILGIIA